MTSIFFGSCHCGAVRFSCDLDISAPSSRCNCSICSKTRLWKSEPLPSHAFRLLQGSSLLVEYRFEGRRIAHMFCGQCGVKIFGRGDKDVFPAEFYVVNIAALDAISDELRASLPVVYQDGRNDNWQTPPAITAYL